MKKVFCIFLLVFSQSCLATLIGDLVSVSHRVGDTDFRTQMIAVEEGTSDLVFLLTDQPAYSVNVEGTSVFIDFLLRNSVDAITQWNGLVSFNGPIIQNIDILLTDLSINTNFTQFDESRVSFSGGALSVDFAGLFSKQDNFIEVTFDTPSASAVSAPPVNLLLILSVLCMSLFTRFKRSQPDINA